MAPETDPTLPSPVPGEDDAAGLATAATDRDLARLLEGEADVHVTIDVDDDETPCPTEVMRRPPLFAAEDFPRPSVRVPAPGLPSLFPPAPSSEPRTLVGLHALRDVLVDDTQPLLGGPAVRAPLAPSVASPAAALPPAAAALPPAATALPPAAAALPSAPPVLSPPSEPTPVMPLIPAPAMAVRRRARPRLAAPELPSVVVEVSTSIPPLALDVPPSPPVPRELVLRSLLKAPPIRLDDDRNEPTAVLPRAPVRRSPLVGAALGLAAALGIAATFAVVTTWRAASSGPPAAARGALPRAASAAAAPPASSAAVGIAGAASAAPDAGR